MSDLRAQLDEALERIRQLEEELAGTSVAWPLDWGFTNSERAIMTSLMRHDFADKGNLYFSLYGHKSEDEQAEPKTIDVFVCRIRKRLKPLGLNIQTVWGKGYFISTEDKEAIREMMRFGPTVPNFLEPRSAQAQQRSQ